MPKNEGKSTSRRKPLRDVSNGGKSLKPLKKKVVAEVEGSLQNDALDRLLLAQSDLSALIHQIDQLVGQAFKLKATSGHESKEIETFSNVLSEMLSSLKPWVPKFQKALSRSSTEAENQLEQTLASKTIPPANKNAENIVDSSKTTELDSLISPSPLVSWRAECTIERGRQLFLLTPLPISKSLSSRDQGLSKLVFERITSNVDAGIPSFGTISEDANDDLLEGVEIKPTPNKLSETGATEVGIASEFSFLSTPSFPKKDCSMIVMTPCLKISPPKSCVLLEPISESSHQHSKKIRKQTPFCRRIQNCSESDISESSGSPLSKSLALKYPELCGIQPVHKVGMRRNEEETSPDWFMSPPKTCVLMEPPDDKSLSSATTYCHLPKNAPVLKLQADLSSVDENDIQGGCILTDKLCDQEVGGCSALMESTPLWKEPESIIPTWKRPGENTLKKELWTRFEAASTNGLRCNIPVLQQTAQRGFLDRLDEASSDETSPDGGSLR